MTSVLFMPNHTYVLIAGSRNATPAMTDYALRVVQRIHELGWHVIVGDNPQGIDLAVVQECNRLQAPAVVAGIARTPRNGGCPHAIYTTVPQQHPARPTGNPYTHRDQWMIDNCSKAVFIWNGKSPGTINGYHYAQVYSKTAWLKNFS